MTDATPQPAPLARLDRRGPVATLTLDDPSRMNPLTLRLLKDALAALDTVRADPSLRVLVLRGAGRAFCVGADLNDFPDPDAPAAPGTRGAPEIVDELLGEGGNPLVSALRTLPVPVICAVHGAVAGGGVGLALAADLVVAARSAFFYLPFVPALGLVPDLGASWHMLRAIGPALTASLILCGDRLPADEAQRVGLIARCVETERLDAEVDAMAARLAALPPGAAKETRALMGHAASAGFDAQLAYERGRQRTLMGEADFREGLRAFRQRRAPRFGGGGAGP